MVGLSIFQASITIHLAHLSAQGEYCFPLHTLHLFEVRGRRINNWQITQPQQRRILANKLAC